MIRSTNGVRQGTSGSRVAVLLALVFGSATWSARLAAQTEKRAEAPGIVLVLADAPNDPFVARIKAEIASLGLEVIVRPPKGSLEASARAAHAVAAIRMLPSRNGIEVWMADATSGRSLLRQTIVDEAPGGPNQDVVALQTAELLRTSLFPHEPAEAPKPAPPPPPVRVVVEVPTAPPPPAGESAIRGSLGGLYGAGGASMAFQAGISYRYLWNRGIGIAVEASAPIVRGTVDGTEGSADVGAIIAGAGPVLRLTAPHSRVGLNVGLGAAFVAVLAKGHADAAAGSQLVSNSSTAYTGLGYASAALDLKLSNWFALGLSGLAGVTTSRVRIRFAGNEVGAWGTPVLGVGVFGEFTWR